jgi:hypothetical protein
VFPVRYKLNVDTKLEEIRSLKGQAKISFTKHLQLQFLLHKKCSASQLPTNAVRDIIVVYL